MPLILKESLAVFSIPDEDKNNNTVIGLLELLKGRDLEIFHLRQYRSKTRFSARYKNIG